MVVRITATNGLLFSDGFLSTLVASMVGGTAATVTEVRRPFTGKWSGIEALSAAQPDASGYQSSTDACPEGHGYLDVICCEFPTWLAD